MGGPTEGTYSVQVRHMNVRYPRNLNENDIAMCDDSTTTPLNVPTQMSYFLQRIRLGEIVRAILDSRPHGNPDADITDYDRVLALDQLFEQAFMDLPPFLQINGPFQLENLNAVELQRVIIQLGLLSRRARLHRPFLLQNNGNSRHQKSRETCLECTRAVVTISITIIESSLNLDLRSTSGHPQHAEGTCPRRLPVHRIGSVINHLFMACTVLAFYVGVNPSVDNRGAQPYDSVDEPSADSVRAELAHACRVLAAVGAESQVASGLVRSLVGILRRYRVQGVDGDEILDQLGNQTRNGGRTEKEATDQVEVFPQGTQLGGETMPDSATDEVLGLALDGLWDNFAMDSNGDYSQLFANLDYFCGTT